MLERREPLRCQARHKQLLAVWRVDTALLIVFGLLLIPVSLGRLTLRKAEGLALAILYAVYLVISTAMVIRL